MYKNYRVDVNSRLDVELRGTEMEQTRFRMEL